MKLSMPRFSSNELKSILYLVAISTVMVMLLFSSPVPERDTEVIVQYLSEYTNIPNTVTSVILGTRLFDTIGEVTVFTIAGLGVKILLHDEEEESELIAVREPTLVILLDLAAIFTAFLAIDLALKGHLTPGGGFASGVSGATSITLLMVTGRLKQVEEFYFKSNAAALEKFAVICFVFTALATFMGFVDPQSVFATIPPEIYLPALNIVAALKVTIGSWSILRFFILTRGLM
ncbi:Na(+)/H(+) antiporter subunit B [Parasynechococcus sp.]|uniref:Na(+)/H(+) antiporter subunit B n=1 Tax=Parasynechococcus sp. TaxID=3101203 RepID=UPI00370397E0